MLLYFLILSIAIHFCCLLWVSNAQVACTNGCTPEKEILPLLLSNTTVRIEVPLRHWAFGDFNGDGETDVAVVGEGRIVWMENLGGGLNFMMRPVSAPERWYHQVVPVLNYHPVFAIDGDADGDADICVQPYYSVHEIHCFINDGNVLNVFVNCLSFLVYRVREGKFNPNVFVIDSGAIISRYDLEQFRVADFDDDGIHDLVYLTNTINAVMVITYGPIFASNATAVQTPGVLLNPKHYLLILDYDSDGDLDVVIVYTKRYDPTLFLNGGSRAPFSVTHMQFNDTRRSFYTSFGVADIDGDGDMDCVDHRYFSTGGYTFYEFGYFADCGRASMTVLNNMTAAFIYTQDFDGDGDVDILLRRRPLTLMDHIDGASPIDKNAFSLSTLPYSYSTEPFNKMYWTLEWDLLRTTGKTTFVYIDTAARLVWSDDLFTTVHPILDPPSLDRYVHAIPQMIATTWQGREVLFVARLICSQPRGSRWLEFGVYSAYGTPNVRYDALTSPFLLENNTPCLTTQVVGDFKYYYFDFADINGDSINDLVFRYGGFMWAKGTGQHFHDIQHSISMSTSDRTVLFDCDNDGDLDILVYSRSARQLVYYDNTNAVFNPAEVPLLTFPSSPSPPLQVSEKYESFHLLDFDGDGYEDFILPLTFEVDLFLWGKGGGPSGLTEQSVQNVVNMTTMPGCRFATYGGAYHSGDYDGDGDVDLLCAGFRYGGSTSGDLYMLRNNGSGGFEEEIRLNGKAFRFIPGIVYESGKVVVFYQDSYTSLSKMTWNSQMNRFGSPGRLIDYRGYEVHLDVTDVDCDGIGDPVMLPQYDEDIFWEQKACPCDSGANLCVGLERRLPVEIVIPQPTDSPTLSPVQSPTQFPSVSPSLSPTQAPTVEPTLYPSKAPTTQLPTSSPTASPSPSPIGDNTPTMSPTTPKPSLSPTEAPTPLPTLSPTLYPSAAPSISPTQSPEYAPPVPFARSHRSYYNGGPSKVFLREFAEALPFAATASPVEVRVQASEERVHATFKSALQGGEQFRLDGQGQGTAPLSTFVLAAGDNLNGNIQLFRFLADINFRSYFMIKIQLRHTILDAAIASFEVTMEYRSDVTVINRVPPPNRHLSGSGSRVVQLNAGGSMPFQHYNNMRNNYRTLANTRKRAAAAVEGALNLFWFQFENDICHVTNVTAADEEIDDDGGAQLSSNIPPDALVEVVIDFQCMVPEAVGDEVLSNRIELYYGVEVEYVHSPKRSTAVAFGEWDFTIIVGDALYATHSNQQVLYVEDAVDAATFRPLGVHFGNGSRDDTLVVLVEFSLEQCGEADSDFGVLELSEAVQGVTFAQSAVAGGCRWTLLGSISRVNTATVQFKGAPDNNADFSLKVAMQVVDGANFDQRKHNLFEEAILLSGIDTNEKPHVKNADVFVAKLSVAEGSCAQLSIPSDLFDDVDRFTERHDVLLFRIEDGDAVDKGSGGTVLLENLVELNETVDVNVTRTVGDIVVCDAVSSFAFDLVAYDLANVTARVTVEVEVLPNDSSSGDALSSNFFTEFFSSLSNIIIVAASAAVLGLLVVILCVVCRARSKRKEKKRLGAASDPSLYQKNSYSIYNTPLKSSNMLSSGDDGGGGRSGVVRSSTSLRSHNAMRSEPGAHRSRRPSGYGTTSFASTSTPLSAAAAATSGGGRRSHRANRRSSQHGVLNKTHHNAMLDLASMTVDTVPPVGGGGGGGREQAESPQHKRHASRKSPSPGSSPRRRQKSIEGGRRGVGDIELQPLAHRLSPSSGDVLSGGSGGGGSGDAVGPFSGTAPPRRVALSLHEQRKKLREEKDDDRNVGGGCSGGTLRSVDLVALANKLRTMDNATLRRIMADASSAAGAGSGTLNGADIDSAFDTISTDLDAMETVDSGDVAEQQPYTRLVRAHEIDWNENTVRVVEQLRQVTSAKEAEAIDIDEIDRILGEHVDLFKELVK